MVCYYNALGLARMGRQVTVLTAGGSPGNPADPAEFTVRRLPATFRIGNAPFLPALFSLDAYDIVHLHHPFIFGAEMVCLAAHRRGVPYILTHHNDLIGDGLRRPLFALYAALSTPFVFGGARRLLVASMDYARASRVLPALRTRPADVVELPNGVDTDLFRPHLDGRAVRRRCAIPDGAQVVLFVGPLDRAHHYRRVDLLLRAVRAIGRPNVHLLVAGDGDRATGYRQLAERLGIGPQTHFLGAVAHRDLPAVYAAADLVVLPSDLQESFGLVLVEAMACGRPVVASSLPGARAVVGDGVDGLLVRPGDVADLTTQIVALLDDPPRREEMGAQGRAKVEAQYAWPRIIPRLAAIYEEVLADGQR